MTDADVDRLPLRLDGQAALLLGVQAVSLEIVPVPGQAGELPKMRCKLPHPAHARVLLTLRVHSSAGIPLASASVDVNPGDQTFETSGLTVLAMEGYSHLGHADRQAVEDRVWSRRAFVTASLR